MKVDNKDDMMSGFGNNVCKIVEEKKMQQRRHLVALLFSRGYSEKAPW